MVNKPQLILKPERERSLLRRHPWVFSGAVAEGRGDPQSGATVELISSEGDFLAQAAYSQQSQINARIWSWERDDKIDPRFIQARLQRAIQARAGVEGRKREGLPPRVGALRGALPSTKVHIAEHGLAFEVDLAGGHKTGFYLDQRANRFMVRQLAKDRAVLACFAYTGGPSPCWGGGHYILFGPPGPRGIPPPPGAKPSGRRAATRTSICWPSSFCA